MISTRAKGECYSVSKRIIFKADVKLKLGSTSEMSSPIFLLPFGQIHTLRELLIKNEYFSSILEGYPAHIL
jgi:hypothetical protein